MARYRIADWHALPVDELRALQRTREARLGMVTGVPTFMLDNWPFGGIQEDDTMVSILTRYARKKRERAAAGEPS